LSTVLTDGSADGMSKWGRSRPEHGAFVDGEAAPETGRRPNCDLTANEGRPLEAGAPIFYLSSQTSSMRQPLKMLFTARVSPMT
jgi:hypothetical protein